MTKKKTSSEEESKTTNEKEKKSAKRTRKKSKKKSKLELPCRLIWLYAANERLALRHLQRLLNYGDSESIRIREAMGLDLDDNIIPIYPFPANARSKTLEKIIQLEDEIIIAVGLPQDRKKKKIYKFYEGAELFWVHPGERQFHIDMMAVSHNDMTYPEAIERQKEFLQFFEDHFKSENIQVVR